jgi:large subunit ribosomal protein L21
VAEKGGFAVLELDGSQVLVRPNQLVRVAKRPEAPGKKVKLDKVLFLNQEHDYQIGQPTLKGAQVQCTVKAHGKTQKVIAYRFKKRKGVRRKRGSRQAYTDLLVTSIQAGATTHGT